MNSDLAAKLEPRADVIRNVIVPIAVVFVRGCGVFSSAVRFTAPGLSAEMRTTIAWSTALAKTSRV